MANTGESHTLSGDGSGYAVSADAEVVVVRDAEIAHSGKRNPLSFLPLLLGVLVLALDIYLLVRLPNNLFFAMNLQSAISLALVLASGIICLFLIAYAFGLGRFEHIPVDGDRSRSAPYITWVVVPLLLGVVALAATVGGMEWQRAASERQPQKPCIDLIEQAHNILKDNPKFRMPAKDSNEVRCSINAALGL